jgi:hypothetical protein
VAEQLCAVMGGRFSVTHASSRVTFDMSVPVMLAPPPHAVDTSVGLRVLYADVWLALLSIHDGRDLMHRMAGRAEQPVCAAGIPARHAA